MLRFSCQAGFCATVRPVEPPIFCVARVRNDALAGPFVVVHFLHRVRVVASKLRLVAERAVLI